MDNEYLTADDLAKMFNLTPHGIRKLAREGKIPGKQIGKAWRFKKSEIEAWWAGAELEPAKPALTVKEILDKKLRPRKEDK